MFTDEILDGETREEKILSHPSKQIFIKGDFARFCISNLPALPTRKPTPGKTISSPAQLLLSSISRPSYPTVPCFKSSSPPYFFFCSCSKTENILQLLQHLLYSAQPYPCAETSPKVHGHSRPSSCISSNMQNPDAHLQWYQQIELLCLLQAQRDHGDTDGLTGRRQQPIWWLV